MLYSSAANGHHAAWRFATDSNRRWIRAVESRIATGVGSHRPRHMPRFSETQVEEILRYGAKPLGVAADLCERQYIPVDDAPFDAERVTRSATKRNRSSAPSAAATTSSRCRSTATTARFG
jgi:hypothetical protein